MKENPILRLLHQRASLRVYDKRDISQETLDQILQAMMRAPTAGNQMLYSVIVVRDDVTKQKLAQSCDHQAFIATAPVLLIFWRTTRDGLTTISKMMWLATATARDCGLKRRRSLTCCWQSKMR